IMDVEGVRLVSHIDVEGEPWSLQLAAEQVAKLDVRRCQITLTRGGTILNTGSLPATYLATAAPTASGAGNPLAPALGRNRNLARYGSIMPQFPTAYGVGELGLPASASPERKAQALQLKAYLMFFDQIMANHLAQLAHVKDLFSFDGSEKRTYFAQALAQPAL